MKLFLISVLLSAGNALVAVPSRSVQRQGRHACTFGRSDALLVRFSPESVVVAVAEESGLPDPLIAVVAFVVLLAAFAYTQFDMVQVVSEEEVEGAEGARRARDALARKRGYFRK